MEWDRILKDCVNDGQLRELHLKKIPSLKTCDDWNRVEEVGLVDFKTKHAHYKGGIVKYGERIFYVNEARLEAVSSYRKWNFKRKLKVVPEGKKKA